MADFLDFPALTGTALTQTLSFLFGRLNAVLDRRQQPGSELAEVPGAFEGDIASLEANQEIVEQRRSELESLADILGAYVDQRETVRHDDGRLMRSLAHLRGLLEEVYGQHFAFEGESRPTSGVQIRQRVKEAEGGLVGLDAETVGGEARVDIAQDAEHTGPEATIIGARIRRLG
ncbi:hypothetical protein I0C86_04000 [Plantactinospora sp. S1510]|uniref:Uncharacterized protein n=1 Tax=Plantactinospora alkalitolerans TaxID=2789879 RepID=A0ABS0GQ30_9ACTN|nr:hypothetical protein [Plantactinospora alkalitolerans]MBF9128159.1 hypothetical protein [Plantactinospora alkalitolerans]